MDIKIALAQLNYHIGNFKGNVSKMIDSVHWAESNNADIICFGELAISGYPPRDFLEYDDFIVQCMEALEELKKCSKKVAIIVGCPSRNPVIKGKDLFNSAYVLYDGKVIFKQNKSLLPNYDIFDEYRYFEPAKQVSCFEFKGVKIALTICEDIWNVGNENPLYTSCPMDVLIEQGPDVMINISASPFNYSHAESRIEVVKANVEKYKIPMFYSNNIGSQTEMIFDGGSLVINQDGIIVDEFTYFKEEKKVFSLQEVTNSTMNNEVKKDDISEIHGALILGIRDYFGKLNFSKAVLGLSGGIDSAVTAAVAAEALGSENIMGLLMPSQFSSQHSIDDAVELANNLNIQYEILHIENTYSSFTDCLHPLFKDTEFDVTEENIQARIRGVLLMAYSNKFGYILLNTSNKSEAAIGYGTLYGDMCGGLSILGDVYKTQVYQLAHFINRSKILIPISSIDKAPSAELRPDQKDSDSLPPYDILDKVLFEYIENRLGPKQIIELGYDTDLVARILRLVNINEFKRYQMAPILRVSNKAFGMGRRMPIVGKYLS